jgi:Fe2+ transport system protein FeoA
MPQDLQHVPVDHTVKIVSIEGEDAAAMRVRELGLTCGTVCRIVRKAPFGGPVEVAVGQTHIGIRLNNVVRILVEPHASATP